MLYMLDPSKFSKVQRKRVESCSVGTTMRTSFFRINFFKDFCKDVDKKICKLIQNDDLVEELL